MTKGKKMKSNSFEEARTVVGTLIRADPDTLAFLEGHYSTLREVFLKDVKDTDFTERDWHICRLTRVTTILEILLARSYQEGATGHEQNTRKPGPYV